MGGAVDERANEETSVKAAAQGHGSTERQTSSEDYRLLVSPTRYRDSNRAPAG